MLPEYTKMRTFRCNFAKFSRQHAPGPPRIVVPSALTLKLICDVTRLWQNFDPPSEYFCVCHCYATVGEYNSFPLFCTQISIFSSPMKLLFHHTRSQQLLLAGCSYNPPSSKELFSDSWWINCHPWYSEITLQLPTYFPWYFNTVPDKHFITTCSCLPLSSTSSLTVDVDIITTFYHLCYPLYCWFHETNHSPIALMVSLLCSLDETTCARFLSAEFDQSCPARLQLYCTSDFSDVKIGMNYDNIMVMICNRLYNKQLKDSISAVIFNLLPVIQQNFLKKQQIVACPK